MGGAVHLCSYPVLTSEKLEVSSLTLLHVWDQASNAGGA